MGGGTIVMGGGYNSYGVMEIHLMLNYLTCKGYLNYSQWKAVLDHQSSKLV